MDINLLELMQQLAAKLGVTADHIWTVMVQQAHVAAITNVVTGGILVFLAIAAGCISYSLSKDDNSEGTTAMFFLGVALFVISLAFIFPAITAFVNPEYWALKHMIKMI